MAFVFTILTSCEKSARHLDSNNLTLFRWTFFMRLCIVDHASLRGEASRAWLKVKINDAPVSKRNNIRKYSDAKKSRLNHDENKKKRKIVGAKETNGMEWKTESLILFVYAIEWKSFCREE